MNFKDNLKYNEEHLWLKIEDNKATIGITDFAQSRLGEILFVELPDVDDEFDLGEEFSVVESSKSASSLYAPFNIKILEVNEKLDDEPEYINEDPYGGWIIKAEIMNNDSMGKLIDCNEYKDIVNG